MVSTDNNNSPAPRGPAPWGPDARAVSPFYKSAWTTALIGAIFSIVILTLITANYIQGRIREARLEKRLEAMKIELTADPADEQALTDRIRLCDLEFRQSRLPRPNFTRTPSIEALITVCRAALAETQA